MRRNLTCILLISILSGCAASKSSFSPKHRYSPSQLQKDFTIYQTLLEEFHPGLYWYTSRDSMDYYFNWGKQQLKDSLTEPAFKKILTYVTAKIDCGHTSVRSSKAWNKYRDTAKIKRLFPLSLKLWKDTAVVTANLNRNDSTLTPGIVITSINGKKLSAINDSLFQYISSDGYNQTHKYQTLSNQGYFGSLYSYIFGKSNEYEIGYLDSNQIAKTIEVPAYFPAKDTANRKGNRSFRPSIPHPSKKEIRQRAADFVRLLKIDTVTHTAMMDLSSFAKGYNLRQFFRNSFRTLQKHSINYLIIDVRRNGGGSVGNSTFLSRYIADEPFKIADSLYAIKKGKKYQRYIKNQFWNKLFLFFFTKKKKDGYYHFGFFERHFFNPIKKNHYNGKVYVLSGGNSFSATTLFISTILPQKNVTVIGEETGGGAYGNTAWLIPYAKLPETGIQFRLPLFRLVINKETPKNGLGVQPEIYTPPTVQAVKNGVDYKLKKALELINKDRQENKE
ncbi:MAG: S41 family peptidase [Chitinophagaceae bacterium]|nr:peptidase S41 [Chitinophagaceae bacterium]HQU56331.1 S41 family peptidase [Chitinophagaceae bacterium]HQV05832.1 S41 family peptidase [Chitinophagaceae bacterium]